MNPELASIIRGHNICCIVVADESGQKSSHHAAINEALGNRPVAHLSASKEERLDDLAEPIVDLVDGEVVLASKSTVHDALDEGKCVIVDVSGPGISTADIIALERLRREIEGTAKRLILTSSGPAAFARVPDWAPVCDAARPQLPGLDQTPPTPDVDEPGGRRSLD